MKTLSLLQPWASLVVLGAKKFETRSWSTKYRGPLLIHASKKYAAEYQLLAKSEPFFTALLNADMATGKIIGVVDLVYCMKTIQALNCDLSKEERIFGDFSPGRFAWKLENPVAFDAPISARGSLGLWEFPESKLAERKQAQAVSS